MMISITSTYGLLRNLSKPNPADPVQTQSGTQWDGFRHFAHVPTQTFYNGTKGSDILGTNANHKCSIHHWSVHGFSGRGVLLDYRSYATAQGIVYDSAT